MNALAATPKTAAGSPALWSLAPHRPAPRDAGRLLVAVAASADGRIGGSFEDCSEFLLFEKHNRDTCFVGRQRCPFSESGDDRARRARLFADCDLVICSKIGETCRLALSGFGVGCELACAGAAVDDTVSAL